MSDECYQCSCLEDDIHSAHSEISSMQDTINDLERSLGDANNTIEELNERIENIYIANEIQIEYHTALASNDETPYDVVEKDAIGDLLYSVCQHDTWVLDALVDDLRYPANEAYTLQAFFNQSHTLKTYSSNKQDEINTLFKYACEYGFIDKLFHVSHIRNLDKTLSKRHGSIDDKYVSEFIKAHPEYLEKSEILKQWDERIDLDTLVNA